MAEIKRWIPLALWTIFGVTALGGGVMALLEDDPGPTPPHAATSPHATPSPDYTYELPQSFAEAGVPADEAGCSAVDSPPDQGAHQVEQGENHPPYNSTPPTSGWYSVGALTPALYYVPFDPEVLVRNMAEGDVVIWHSGLSEPELQDLKGVMVLLESEQLVGLPYSKQGLEQKIVLTAWGHIQRCEELSGEVIAEFFDRYVGRGPLVA
jgi:hypothetical protein